jgi:hypothetical protein
MARTKNRLPKRFPVGTTFVVEGRAAGSDGMRVVTRYVQLPNGRRIDLPAGYVAQCGCHAARRRRSDRGARHEQPAHVAI